MNPVVHLALLALSAAAQTPPTTPTPAPVGPTEEAVILRFRAHARSRKVAPGSPLSAEEQNTIRRFREAKPSVVFVSAISKGRDPQTQNIQKIPEQTGTGFVWDEWGHIVTNHHVISMEREGRRVDDVEEVEITLANGKTYKGRVIGASYAFDIAVIQVFAPLESLRPIPIGQSSRLQVGQAVMAIGNPFGLDHSLSKGVVSALGRGIDTGYNTRILDSIQTDAAVNPGNSGGPLLDSSGRMIGMNTAIVATKGQGSVGVGFAIPVDTLNRIVPQLIARERLEPPRMGFWTVPSYLAEKWFGLQRGLVVRTVDPDTPASRAGLRPLELDQETGTVKVMGDVLLGYQGRLIESDAQLLAMLEVEAPKDEIVFDVLRDGQEIKVVLHLDKDKPAEKSKTGGKEKLPPASL